MKSISKLKDEARRHEQREAWESAIHAYLQVLAAGEEGENELEISLYNRVGDLFVRLNRSRDAVQYYEKAADRYADAGLFNNAIALCNKALRYMPDRAELLHKLGQYSAGQGFHTDARRYYLEYAEKQFASGGIDAALRALEELAQVEETPDLRELMGHRLHANGRVAEALTHLKRAYELRLGAGEAERAEALRREIALIDPTALDGSPSPATGQARLDARASAIAPAAMDTSLTQPEAAPEAEPELGGGGLVVERPDDPVVVDVPAGPAGVIDGFESGTFEGLSGTDGPAPLSGLEIDDFEDQPEARVEMSDLERADEIAGDDVASERLPGLETGAAAEPPPSGVDSALSFDLALIHYTEEPESPEAEPAALPLMEDEPEALGELPLLDEAEEEDSVPLPLLEDDAPEREGSAVPLDDAADAEPLAAEAVELPEIEEPEELASAPPWNFPSLTTDLPRGRPAEPAFGGLDRELDDVLASALERAAEEARREDAPVTDPQASLEGPGGFGMAEPAELPQREEPPAEPTPLTPLTGWHEPPPAAARLPREEEPAAPPVEAAAKAPAEPEDIAAPPPLPSLLSRAAAGMRAAFERLEGAGEADRTAGVNGEAAAHDAIPADVASRLREPAAPEPVHSAPEPESFAPEIERFAPEPERAAPEIEYAAPEIEHAAPEPAAPEIEHAAPEPAAFMAEPAPEAVPEPMEAAAPPEVSRRPVQEQEETEGAQASVAEPGAEAAPEYMDLASFLVEPEPEADTRFVVQEKPPTGDEDQDFAELLSQFKQKVAENVSVEDAAAHYDLGLAFKEMGLIEEAIGEFQVALRAGDMRLKVYEELGQCFLLRGQYNIAEKVLRRALESPFDDELELLGVYYHLGRACEELGKREAARDAYERVLGIDINFADVSARLARL